MNMQSNAILIEPLEEKSASLHSSVYNSYKNDYFYLNDPHAKGEQEISGLEGSTVKLKKRKRSFKEGVTKYELYSQFIKSSSIWTTRHNPTHPHLYYLLDCQSIALI